MALLGKFFKGSGKDDNSGSRAKRGRAPSIRTTSDGTGLPDAAPPLPEINIEDLEKPRQAPARPDAETFDPMAKPAVKAPEPPPIDLDPAPAKPVPAPVKAPAAARPAPRNEQKTTAVPPPSAAPSPAGGGSSTADRRSSRLQSRQKPIGEILIQAGTVSTEQLSRALKIQDKGGRGLVGQILVNMGACTQQSILTGLNRQFRISTIELDRIDIQPHIAALVPADKCREHRLVPFEKIGTTLCISMANCLNRKAINEVEELTKLKVKPFNSTWIEIRKAIEAVEKLGPIQQPPADAEPTVMDVEPAAAAAPSAPAAQAPIELEPPTPKPAAQAAPIEVAPAAPAPTPAPAAPSAQPEPAEAAPFVGPAKARIEGLDTLDSAEAEVVQLTERGMASKHFDEIRSRRTERQKLMGTGKGVVGRLSAPGLDDYRPEDAPATQDCAAQLIPLRLVDEQLLVGAALPTAKELAANVDEFMAAETAAPAPAPAAEEAAQLPAVPAISFAAAAAGELAPVAISDEEWAAMEADLEPDPVVAWQATYASAGPVPAAQSWL